MSSGTLNTVCQYAAHKGRRYKELGEPVNPGEKCWLRAVAPPGLHFAVAPAGLKNIPPILSRARDAQRFKAALAERFGRFHLELHPDKTRLLEFGRFASENRKRRGHGKPETFDFLGFTHYCHKTREGWFTVGRKTSAKRRRAKLAALKEVLRRRLHAPIGEVGARLGSVVRGHDQYFGVARNSAALASFRFAVVGLWHKTLCRRSQRATVTWDPMQCIADRWIPMPCVVHPYPQQRLRLVMTQGRSPVR